ncbi:MAG: sulfatase-like hydrolase/transferase, partial [Roseobacter sp.]
MVRTELDNNAGGILARLEEPNISNNTIVVFTSDNGPETITWPDG